MAKRKVNVRGTEIVIFSKEKEDYISLSDIARYKDSERSDYILQNWMRNRSTIEFIGLWEQIHNPNFNSIEFDGFKNEAGSNSFTLTPKKWITATNAIGIISKAGRYGGTYAHQDIAFEFASWISAEFKLYLLKEFQRLKQIEVEQKQLEWNVSRTLAKVNYLIHTDAIKENLIPENISKSKRKFVYADEADLLNIALFGKTAKEWREKYPVLRGNIRDYATLEQLVVLSNMESYNSELIKMQIPSDERLKKLNKIAIDQMKVLIANRSIKKLKE
ncbi:MAG: KilA-N domain-containing protein [Proteobacteria bacterium]|nr:KilA-N domain-containing protein [Desulfobacteraceae bacterium]MBU4011978.1 KilA-N domain-containing protein [Pseudomonadota bacterium]MBU4069122.1 KilA-N domain-containing protein [Pseudomonadota bacterium]MBU4127816.1 KilA-N domain-containing protein [Pseudomonadota bacterium]MCG2758160.1 KilA-N domain-containing protein [Desulfobacteraceae bacterium]